MSARKNCLSPEGCDGGYHWIGYSGTPTLALWMPADANQPRGCWRSFGGREFEPDSKIGRAHTYLGPVAAWNRRAPPPLPTREELAQVLCAAEGSPCACATRNYDDGVCCSDGSWAPYSPLIAADAVLRLLGGEKTDA